MRNSFVWHHFNARCPSGHNFCIHADLEKQQKAHDTQRRPLEVTFLLESVWGRQPSQVTDTPPSQPTRPLNPSKLFTKNIKRDNESHLEETVEHIWLESLEKIMAHSSHLRWWHFSHHSKPLWVKNRRGPIAWYIFLRYILMCSIPVWKICFVLSKHPWKVFTSACCCFLPLIKKKNNNNIMHSENAGTLHMCDHIQRFTHTCMLTQTYTHRQKCTQGLTTVREQYESGWWRSRCLCALRQEINSYCGCICLSFKRREELPGKKKAFTQRNEQQQSL